MDGYVGCINLDVRFVRLKHRVIHQALGHLQLNASLREVGKLGLATLAEAQDVGVIELDFRARAISRGNRVTSRQRCVDRGGHPICGVSALGGNVPVNQADACDSRLGLVLGLLFPLYDSGCQQTQNCNHQN